MKEFTNQEAVENAILISQTFNTYATKPNELTPAPLDNTDIIKNWNVAGYINSNNGFFADLVEEKDKQVFFGYLLQSKTNPNEYKAVIRGTANKTEWCDNFKSLLEYHKEIGWVESGFYDIYENMTLTTLDGKTTKIAQGLSELVNNNKNAHLTITGHSLGSALSTYVMYDVSKQVTNKESVDMCLFASPKPGNEKFSEDFQKVTDNYVVYNYSRDLVPDVPLEITGYEDLQNVKRITPQTSQAVIKDEVTSNHHVICYAAMLDYNAKKPEEWSQLLKDNGCENDCIQGPSNPDVKVGFSLYDVVDRIRQVREKIFDAPATSVTASLKPTQTI